MATNHEAEVCDNMVALVADAAHCLVPHSMNLPRKGWEGQQYSRTLAGLVLTSLECWVTVVMFCLCGHALG